MRQQGLAIVGRRITDGDGIDRDTLFGQPDDAGIVSPDHLVCGFHDGPVTLVAQRPRMRTRLPILATTPLGQLRLGLLVFVSLIVFAVAHKLAQACYYILRDQVLFDVNKAFA
jgi:hypothetical protein